MSQHESLQPLIERALALGMDDAQLLSIDQLQVEPELAGYCGDCEAYAKTALCPPYSRNVEQFLAELKNYQQLLVFKRDVPLSVLLDDEQLDISRQLHLTAAQLEKQARRQGMNAAGYGAGSCKRLFCESNAHCQALQPGGVCRFPHWARPSVSGVGINVFELCHTLGWPISKVTKDTPPDPDGMGVLVGLVLLGNV